MKKLRSGNMVLWCMMIMMMMVLCESEQRKIEKCPNLKTEVANVRKKRALTFPDGSNFVMTISLVKAFMTHAPAGWNIALEIDVMFPLPDANSSNAFWRKKVHKRQKRDFWERLQGALNLHNLNGRSCILRSICEAKLRLAEPGNSLVHDILRAVFTFPETEEELAEEYHNTYDELKDPNFCQKENDCPLSLINYVMVLNKR